VAGDEFWNAFLKLPDTLEDGTPGFEKAYGTSWFAYLAEHPDEGSQFNSTMIGFHGAEPPAVADAYDFSAVDTIVDVGGSTGHMLATILERYPGPEGVLFELPRVVREAPALLDERGVADRVTCTAGDFFDQVPDGGDVYILSHILHDWSRDRCLTILRNCRAAMRPDGRLLIVEMVLPDEGPPHPGYELDMVMLALTGGRERTEAEYAALLEESGFSLNRVIPTDSPVSVVEAVPA
jgi:SAM-dependent methyltransferase